MNKGITRLIVGLVVMGVCGGLAEAAPFSDTCKFSWTANTETDLAGYRAFMSKGGVQGPVVTVPVGPTPNVSCAQLGITTTTGDGGYLFTVIAFDNAQTANLSTPAAITETRDTVEPNTMVLPTINGASASFALSSNETGTTFECKLDTGAWGPCVTPKTYANLADGSHTFMARAKDAAQNVDPTEGQHVWAVNLSAPTQPSGLSVTPNFP